MQQCSPHRHRRQHRPRHRRQHRRQHRPQQLLPAAAAAAAAAGPGPPQAAPGRALHAAQRHLPCRPPALLGPVQAEPQPVGAGQRRLLLLRPGTCQRAGQAAAAGAGGTLAAGGAGGGGWGAARALRLLLLLLLWGLLLCSDLRLCALVLCKPAPVHGPASVCCGQCMRACRLHSAEAMQPTPAATLTLHTSVPWQVLSARLLPSGQCPAQLPLCCTAAAAQPVQPCSRNTC
jgi:hypothetical protein